MNVNIIVAVENEIVKEGLTSIIYNGILGISVLNIHKENLRNKLRTNFYEIIIVEIRKENNADLKLMHDLFETLDGSKTKIFLFTDMDIESKIGSLIKYNNVEIITYNDKTLAISRKLRLHLQYHKKKKTFIKRNIAKLIYLNSILSNRELEIGSLLVKGFSISEIAAKKNLATSTVSTYKRRIFEKIKVRNVIELAKSFEKYQQKNNYV